MEVVIRVSYPAVGTLSADGKELRRMSMVRLSVMTALLQTCALVSLAHAQNVLQSRGADPQGIDYAALTRFSPWDDRNYLLTREDLQVLAPNEDQLSDPIPVFFRAQMRRAWPELPKEGPAQYPRSALQIFQQFYGGFRVGDQTIREVGFNAGRFIVVRPEREEESREGGPSRLLLGEVRVTVPEGAAESAIKANPSDPNIMIAGSNGPGLGQKMHFSSDGGVTWTEVALPLGGTCCDPTVEWSSDGTLAYTATLGSCSFSGCGVWFYRSGDNGQSWTDLSNDTPGDPRRELTNGGSDKEMLHVDRFSASPHLDNIYLTWHQANIMQFARSTDRGNTWTKTSFSSDPRGIGSDITTDKNGNIYYFWPATNDRKILLKRSSDGGVTFMSGTTKVADTNGAFDFAVPSMESRKAWIYVSADVDVSTGPYGGRIYVAWTDTTAAECNEPCANPASNHTRIQVAHSTDGGATWTVATPHETTDQDKVDRYNQWLAVAPDGGVHVVFYDTRNDATRESVDLYHSVSNDGGVSFSAPTRLTSVSSSNILDVFEFGDYNALDAFLNKYITVYTDNRQEGPGTGDSVDVYAVGSESEAALAQRRRAR
jgi:hypothetical protein